MFVVITLIVCLIDYHFYCFVLYHTTLLYHTLSKALDIFRKTPLTSSSSLKKLEQYPMSNNQKNIDIHIILKSPQQIFRNFIHYYCFKFYRYKHSEHSSTISLFIQPRCLGTFCFSLITFPPASFFMNILTIVSSQKKMLRVQLDIRYLNDLFFSISKYS